MSKEAYVDFYENYLNSPAGESLRKELDSVGNGEDFLNVATKGGNAAGFEFTREEVREVMRASEARMAKDAAGVGGEELSDDQLENVAGGAGDSYSSSPTVSIRNLPSSIYNEKPDYYSGGTLMCPW